MKGLALLGAPKAQWPCDIKKQIVAVQQMAGLLIGVDRGSLLLEELGFVPDLAVGDFDSLQKFELAKIQKNVADIRYSVPEKDLTDTELMLRYAFENYHLDHLTAIGATGGRLDHFLTNLFMLLKPEFNGYAEKIEFLDLQNSFEFYNSGTHIIRKKKDYTYFGVVPLNVVQDLSIVGAKYDLQSYSTKIPVSLSSNEFLSEKDYFKLSFTTGTVAVIQSKDVDRYQNFDFR
ncbi:thiamine diphosphokinase [Lactobacillus sp. ESL0228]|uniref:thiamine diphosphokinase n=1 Tax=Lactobacillus sp. ESL0228 TaxID=2069352 RepID=UPI000EFA3BF2|nr:thiamine diphosphokinase [Lactobacillus sp. ESL0228]RMC49004.1 thiamine diphosphokinase [Lactobacillus sp. ESL0228]